MYKNRHKINGKDNCGKCAICGKYKRLTFEHIPPNKALNNSEARFITGDEVIKLVTSEDRLPWDVKGLKYTQEQKGAGKRTLCKECNNLTGSYYGDEYCKFAKEFASYLCKNKEIIKAGYAVDFNVRDFYPLRFIKQVLSMLCSTTTGLSDSNHDIRRLLLHKDEKIKNPNFKLSMFLVVNRLISWTGWNALFMVGKEKPRELSEIIAYPFGFIFDYDGDYIDDRLLDITSFLSYEYDQKVTLNIIIPILEKNMPFPTDFRTKEDVLNTISNKKIIK